MYNLTPIFLLTIENKANCVVEVSVLVCSLQPSTEHAIREKVITKKGKNSQAYFFGGEILISATFIYGSESAKKSIDCKLAWGTIQGVCHAAASF